MKKYLSGTILVLAAIVLLGITQAGGAAPPQQPAQPVLVTNTPGEAVPTVPQGVTQVEGQVSISNLPSISLAGPVGARPLLGAGAFSGITGSVFVGGGRVALAGPFTPDQKVAIGSFLYWNSNDSDHIINLGVVEYSALSDPGACGGGSQFIHTPMILKMEAHEKLQLTFPQPLVLPTRTPTNPWCVTVAAAFGSGNTGNTVVMTGFVE